VKPLSSELTDKEKALAGQVAVLQDATARPKIEGGGMVGETLNFISAHVPPALVKIALVVFLGYHAWDYYNRAQQMVAQVESKRAEAMETQAKADGVNAMVDGQSTARNKLKAELAQLRAAAEIAKANALALGTQVNGGTLRLATIKAELEKTNAEGAKTQAEADAQNQSINGIPLAVAQKQAEVDALQSKIQAQINAMREITRTLSSHWVYQ
jgi:uncharacterized protein (DUF2249 family)